MPPCILNAQQNSPAPWESPAASMRSMTCGWPTAAAMGSSASSVPVSASAACRPALLSSSADSLSQSPSWTAWISCSFRSGACKQLAEAAAVGRGRARRAKARRRRRRRRRAGQYARCLAPPAHASHVYIPEQRIGGPCSLRGGRTRALRRPSSTSRGFRPAEPTIKPFEYSSARAGLAKAQRGWAAASSVLPRSVLGSEGTFGALAAWTDPCSIQVRRHFRIRQTVHPSAMQQAHGVSASNSGEKRAGVGCSQVGNCYVARPRSSPLHPHAVHVGPGPSSAPVEPLSGFFPSV